MAILCLMSVIIAEVNRSWTVKRAVNGSGP